MNWKLFAICVAAVVLAASGAQAKVRHHDRHHAAETARIAGIDYSQPSQPIAYALLDAYLHASPRERAARDWSLGSSMSATATSSSSAVSTSSNDTTAPPSGANQASASAPTEAGSGAAPQSNASATPANSAAAPADAGASSPPTTPAAPGKTP